MFLIKQIHVDGKTLSVVVLFMKFSLSLRNVSKKFFCFGISFLFFSFFLEFFLKPSYTQSFFILYLNSNCFLEPNDSHSCTIACFFPLPIFSHETTALKSCVLKVFHLPIDFFLNL